ncbi:MAG: hypothetical protein ACRC46_10305 [Thermoguttaceae bacterium]
MTDQHTPNGQNGSSPCPANAGQVSISKEEMTQARKIAKAVFGKHFEEKGISADKILINGVHRENFLAKCWEELGTSSLSDAFLSELLKLRKNAEVKIGKRQKKKVAKQAKKS